MPIVDLLIHKNRFVGYYGVQGSQNRHFSNATHLNFRVS